jgi:hypothetical protein
MAKYLAIFEDRTTEEGIELYGFNVMTSKEMNSYSELIDSITWEFEFTLMDGASYVTYPNGEELFSRISFREISNDEFNTIDKLFNGSFGIFPNEDFLHGILEESGDLDDGEYDDYDDEE